MGKGSKKKRRSRKELVRSENPPSARPTDVSTEPQYLTRFQGTVFQGPLPPPEILKGYNDAIPDGAERIVAMAERNQAHRHGLEKSVILKGLRNESIGQWLAFVLYLGTVGGGIYLVSIGKDVTGLAILIANTGVFAGLYFHSKKTKKRELEKKRSEG